MAKTPNPRASVYLNLHLNLNMNLLEHFKKTCSHPAVPQGRLENRQGLQPLLFRHSEQSPGGTTDWLQFKLNRPSPFHLSGQTNFLNRANGHAPSNRTGCKPAME
jgi:hypothetical protein